MISMKRRTEPGNRRPGSHESVGRSNRSSPSGTTHVWPIFVSCCVTVALVSAGVSIAADADPAPDAAWFAVLLALGVVQAEISRRIERERRTISGYTHINVTTVWLVAAAVLVSPGWAALLAGPLYAHLWLRVWRAAGTWRFDRMLASAAIAAISTWAASGAVHYTAIGSIQEADGLRIVVVVLVATVTLDAVNAAVIAFAIFLRTGTRTPSALFGSWHDNAFEMITLCLGATAAVLLAGPAPPLVALVFPPLLILHRAALTEQLETLAVTDAKTSVFNAAGWEHQARRALTAAHERGLSAAVLMIDVDRFKRINDNHGHFAGDDVLRELAHAIKTSVRHRDIVGRFGGEEFVVLLPDIATADAVAVAERIRCAAEQLRVPVATDGGPAVIDHISVSIGMATCPADAQKLQEVLDAADTALYSAKRNGRNRLVDWRDISAS